MCFTITIARKLILDQENAKLFLALLFAFSSKKTTNPAASMVPIYVLIPDCIDKISLLKNS